MKQLWYKKYRPKTLDGFVFVDDHIKSKIEEWVDTEEFPHLLLAGAPGTGKCLDVSEEVSVEIDPSSITEKQHRRLAHYGDMKYRLPIGELFSILDIDDIEYDKPVSTPARVKITAVDDYVTVHQFVKKRHTVAEYILEDGSSIKCSTKHIVFEDGRAVCISEANALDTIHGTLEIVESMVLGERDVYDVALDAPHQYVTPNGIIHHNTTLAYILINECKFEDVDVKYIAASVSKGIDTIRDEIITFVERSSFGGKGRVVILDEVDETTRPFMTALRNLIGEMYDSCRFILTANYPQKIIPALKSRLHTINFSTLDQETFVMRVCDILEKEKVSYAPDVLLEYVHRYYPDMRRTINALENNTVKGVLKQESSDATEESPDWMKEAIVYFEQGAIKEARQKIVGNITDALFDDFYEMLYKNLDWFSKSDDGQDAALLAIKNAYVDDKLVANREIVLSSCLAQLSKISRKMG